MISSLIILLAIVECVQVAVALDIEPSKAPSSNAGSVQFLQPTLPPTPVSGEDQPEELLGLICLFFPRWCWYWSGRPPPPPPPTPSPTPSPAPPPAARSAFDYVLSSGKILANDDPSAGEGNAVLRIMAGENNVQHSSFNWRSFKLENTGSKRIAAVFIDVTTAMFPNVVFDDDGSGGDDVSKKLSNDWGVTETGPISIDSYRWKWLPARSASDFNPAAAFDPTDLRNVNNLFVDEVSNSGLGASGGFRGELILFNDFDPNETYEFSGDLDPNALAGLTQGSASLHSEWDIGGVSGAEMINSVVTVLFGDGSIASGTIASDGSQAGAIALISGDLKYGPRLTVDGKRKGFKFTSNPKSVVVSSNPGDTVRVSMVSAFDPVGNDEPLAGGAISVQSLVTARLRAQCPTFPVSNARKWQHLHVVIPQSGSLNLGSSFRYYISEFAIGFTAVVLGEGGVPSSRTASPIHLVAA